MLHTSPHPLLLYILSTRYKYQLHSVALGTVVATSEAAHGSDMVGMSAILGALVADSQVC